MSRNRHILIVDDEADLRQTLARILQSAGYEVTTAENGRVALSILNNATLDLVYLDIRMPDIDGLEVLKIIHTHQPHLPVILFTARPDIQSALDALRFGATDYLLKPLRPEAVLERTQQVLLHQEKERRKREIQAQIEALQMELKKLEANDASPISELPLDSRHLLLGIFNFDLIARRLTINGRAVDLPPTSFDYLLVLARHAPHLVDYQTLVTEAQGYAVNAREARELAKWHIHHIRQAIEPNPDHPIYLLNVRGVGYRLVCE